MKSLVWRLWSVKGIYMYGRHLSRGRKHWVREEVLLLDLSWRTSEWEIILSMHYWWVSVSVSALEEMIRCNAMVRCHRAQVCPTYYTADCWGGSWVLAQSFYTILVSLYIHEAHVEDNPHVICAQPFLIKVTERPKCSINQACVINKY